MPPTVPIPQSSPGGTLARLRRHLHAGTPPSPPAESAARSSPGATRRSPCYPASPSKLRGRLLPPPSTPPGSEGLDSAPSEGLDSAPSPRDQPPAAAVRVGSGPICNATPLLAALSVLYPILSIDLRETLPGPLVNCVCVCAQTRGPKRKKGRLESNRPPWASCITNIRVQRKLTLCSCHILSYLCLNSSSSS